RIEVLSLYLLIFKWLYFLFPPKRIEAGERLYITDTYRYAGVLGECRFLPEVPEKTKFRVDKECTACYIQVLVDGNICRRIQGLLDSINIDVAIRVVAPYKFTVVLQWCHV